MKKTTELLRVMRNEKFYRDGKEDECVKRIVKAYADRIEDAIKWDYTGDVTKLREALVGTVAILEEIRDAFENGTGGPRMWEVNDAITEAKAALDEPIHNNK